MQTLNNLPPELLRQRHTLRERILSVTAADFNATALAVFRYQAVYNPVYKTYLSLLGITPGQVTGLAQIPFMPIGFFKQHPVLSLAGVGITEPTTTFASSGTTGTQTSRHIVPDTALYADVSRRIFEQQYGPLTNFHILALLPSYLERNNSSLVYMVQQFIQDSGSAQSGFYLNDRDALTGHLRTLLQQDDRTVLLIGVTFGLLDWIEEGADLHFVGKSNRVIVMETGGMKGRRKELLREEVHALLTDKLALPAIHSEYGMTELLSQAYSPGEGLFYPGATMRVLLRDTNDPFCIYPETYTRTGGINVIDLANLDSCSFIETQDLGQFGPDGTFRVIGRFDNSDIRGCNLMASL
ncbi:acyl transferase [Arsenicibacter rosenii]|uniref:Acyl transferase n=1 Tax=Arsenicibacter rosenii TaxID=1750698 RepID=A0A1S2VEE9_9BACT|nr:acyl transferase [Arsenicibacter rosenii]OIN57093.1 acyl transferase [Arsenicibacter rosenii]